MKIKPAKKPGEVVVKLKRGDALPTGAPPGMQLKRLLVPIDFSECSVKALQYALPFARQFGGSLTLLHVVQVYPSPEVVDVNLPLVERRMQESAITELKTLAEREVGADIPTETVVRLGQPYAEIVEEARARRSDLIVLSTHGYTGLRHFLLGSTAERIVRHAPCPVFVVREKEHDFVPDQSGSSRETKPEPAAGKRRAG